MSLGEILGFAAGLIMFGLTALGLITLIVLVIVGTTDGEFTISKRKD